MEQPTDYSHLVFPTKPLRIGITGGIGSGKSYVCAKISAKGYPVYYCDDEAKRIIRTSPVVHDKLVDLIGSDVYSANGTLQKPVLAAYLCSSKLHAAEVDRIVHPCVAEDFRQWCQKQTSPVVFMECALLFESGFDALVQFSALVTVDEQTRLERIMARDHVSEEKARVWIELQMPESEKAKRCDFQLRNTGADILQADLNRLFERVLK